VISATLRMRNANAAVMMAAATALLVDCAALPGTLSMDQDREREKTPLCLVQHDDRVEGEMSQAEVVLIDHNSDMCELDVGCRHIVTKEPFDANVEPHWQKLLAVRNALDSDCQHAIWLDSDVAVHTSQPLKLLDSFGDRSVFACADPPADLTPRFFPNGRSPTLAAKFNAGIWGVANTAAGRALLDAWIGLYPGHLWSVDRGSRLRQNTSSSYTDCLLSRPAAGAPVDEEETKLATMLTARAAKRLHRAPNVAALTSLMSALVPGDATRDGAASATSEEALTLAAELEQRADAASRTAHSEPATVARADVARKPAAIRGVHVLAELRKRSRGRVGKKGTTVRRCNTGAATYAFHERWTCKGSPACNLWANSDAFEQGAFANHLLASPAWRPFITVADERKHNAPCESYTVAEERGALACHFLAEYKDNIWGYMASREKAGADLSADL